MLEALKSWVSNIIAVVLFVTIVEILLPEGKMKKYVTFITGILVIIIIAAPVVKALGSSISFELPETGDISSSNGNVVQNRSEQLTKLQSLQVIKVYKEKLENSIKDQLKGLKGVECTKVVCNIYEKEESRLGEIKSMEITIKNREQKQSENGIKPVEVNINMKRETKQKQHTEVSDEIRNQIVDRVVSIYKVDPSNISVVCQE